MVFLWLILIFFFSFLLVKATDIVLINLKSFSSKTKAGAFAVSGLIAALGTSFPELFVSIVSAFEGKANLALGTVIGSNIANLSIIIGGAALLGGGVTVSGKFLKTDIFYAFLIGAAPMILLFDKSLSRLDGLILLGLYIFYQLVVFQERYKALENENKESFIQRLIRKINHQEARKELGWIILGIALLLFSAEMLVKIAQQLALELKIPMLLVGLILVALGTSLPELVFSVKAIRAHQPQMVFGNLLGSVVANATLILGLAVIISPIKVVELFQYLLATMAFVVVFGAFYFFVKTKRRLESWEGAFLVGFYLAFVLSEFLKP
ncbi:MAG: sodium:calcium antiporter [Microgenomates group bacterium]